MKEAIFCCGIFVFLTAGWSIPIHNDFDKAAQGFWYLLAGAGVSIAYEHWRKGE